MSSTNDPIFSDSMKRNVAELHSKKTELAAVKKAIKDDPDNRYTQRKQLGIECKELAALICEELDDDDEILVGRRRFKKQRTAPTKYTKDRVYDFCSQKSIDPNAYDAENSEDKVGLKAVSKNAS